MSGLLLAEDETLEAALSFLDHFDPQEDPLDEEFEPLELYADAEPTGSGPVFVFGAASADENAHSSVAIVVPSGDQTTALAASSKKPRKKKPRPRTSDYNPNRARDERKEELIYLRKKVSEMEDQLEQLKSSVADSHQSAALVVRSASKSMMRADSGALMMPRSSMDSAVASECSAATVWEEIASHQYAERHKAELENIRLKMVLEGQIKVAKSLEKILKKRNNVQIFPPSDTEFRAKRLHRTSTDSEDAAIFQELLAGVERALTDVTTVFEANGLSKTERPFQDAKIRKNEEQGMFLEIIGNKIMPFDLQVTGDAVWRHFTRSIKGMPFRAYFPTKMEITDDTIIESFGVQLTAKRTTGDFRCCQVLRRYVEQSRVLIVWRSTLSPVEFSSQPTSGICFREQGYIVIRQPSAMDASFSLMQSCFIMTPEVDGQIPEQQNTVGQLTDFLLDSIARKLGLSHQMIENSLMGESLKRNATNTMVICIVSLGGDNMSGPLHLEDETLEAALSFLDEFEPHEDLLDEELCPVELYAVVEPLGAAAPVTEETLVTTTSATGTTRGSHVGQPSTSSPSRVKPPKRRTRHRTNDFNPNRARDERKNELVYLRRKVCEMEAQLQLLKGEGCENQSAAVDAALKATAGAPTKPRSSVNSAECSAATVWEEIASHQHAERHQAELENIRLRMVLEGQIKLSNNLQTILMKRSSNAQIFPPSESGFATKRLRRTSTDTDDAEIFQELMVGVERALTDVSTVFEANGLSKTERPFQDAKIHNQGRILEVIGNKIVPFELQVTGDAVWRHFSRSIKNMPFRAYSPTKLEVVDDTITEDFDIQLTAKGTTSDFRCCQVLRRYVEQDRVLIVWRSTLFPVEFAAQPTSGIRFREQGYIVIRQPSFMDSSFSLIQSCFLETSELEHPIPELQTKAWQITSFLLVSFARTLSLCHQMIENCLVGESLQRSIPIA